MWETFEKAKEYILKDGLGSSFEQDSELEREIESVMLGTDGGETFASKKARAVCIMLNKAELRAGKENIFVYMLNHSRIMHKVCANAQRRLKRSVITEEISSLEETKAFRAMMDFGHVAPDWNYLLDRGLCGVISDLETAMGKHGADEKKTEYYKQRISVYRAMQRMLLRFADLAQGSNTEKGAFIADGLRALSESPPKTTPQALQLILLFYVIQTHIDTVTVRSLGGIDRMICRFYKNDIESGRFTERQLDEILKYFLISVTSMKVNANLPLNICGMKDDGTDGSNELKLAFLRAYRELDIYDPKIHVLYHDGMDKKTLRLILEMIREGKSSFVFINTKVSSAALEKIGVSREDAKRVIPYGCYEPAAEGNEVPCTCAGLLNLAKSIELVFDSDSQYSTFDDFYKAVVDKLLYYTDVCMDTLVTYEHRYDDVCPSMIMSPTYKTSRESGIDVYSGGAKYNNTSIVGAGMATLIDGLLAVKHVVYTDRLKTLDELRSLLRSNWAQDPKLRLYILKSYPKFGNGIKEADELACDVYDRFSEHINGKRNGRGGVFRCGMFSVDWRFGMGRVTGATPDGRLSGEPLSKNLCASVGQDKNGVTAYLNSLLKLDGTKCPDGYVADVQLHSSAVEGEEGMTAFEGLLRTFMSRGGFAVHFNVLDPETLIKAQEDPDSYANLQIRLCGWNVLFNDLDKAQQDEFINRSRG